MLIQEIRDDYKQAENTLKSLEAFMPKIIAISKKEAYSPFFEWDVWMCAFAIPFWSIALDIQYAKKRFYEVLAKLKECNPSQDFSTDEKQQLIEAAGEKINYLCVLETHLFSCFVFSREETETGKKNQESFLSSFVSIGRCCVSQREIVEKVFFILGEYLYTIDVASFISPEAKYKQVMLLMRLSGDAYRREANVLKKKAYEALVVKSTMKQLLEDANKNLEQMKRALELSGNEDLRIEEGNNRLRCFRPLYLLEKLELENFSDENINLIHILLFEALKKYLLDGSYYRPLYLWFTAVFLILESSTLNLSGNAKHYLASLSYRLWKILKPTHDASFLSQIFYDDCLGIHDNIGPAGFLAWVHARRAIHPLLENIKERFSEFDDARFPLFSDDELKAEEILFLEAREKAKDNLAKKDADAGSLRYKEDLLRAADVGPNPYDYNGDVPPALDVAFFDRNRDLFNKQTIGTLLAFYEHFHKRSLVAVAFEQENKELFETLVSIDPALITKSFYETAISNRDVPLAYILIKNWGFVPFSMNVLGSMLIAKDSGFFTRVVNVAIDRKDYRTIDIVFGGAPGMASHLLQNDSLFQQGYDNNDYRLILLMMRYRALRARLLTKAQREKLKCSPSPTLQCLASPKVEVLLSVRSLGSYTLHTATPEEIVCWKKEGASYIKKRNIMSSLALREPQEVLSNHLRTESLSQEQKSVFCEHINMIYLFLGDVFNGAVDLKRRYEEYFLHWLERLPSFLDNHPELDDEILRYLFTITTHLNSLFPRFAGSSPLLSEIINVTGAISRLEPCLAQEQAGYFLGRIQAKTDAFINFKVRHALFSNDDYPPPLITWSNNETAFLNTLISCGDVKACYQWVSRYKPVAVRDEDKIVLRELAIKTISVIGDSLRTVANSLENQAISAISVECGINLGEYASYSLPFQSVNSVYNKLSALDKLVILESRAYILNKNLFSNAYLWSESESSWLGRCAFMPVFNNYSNKRRFFPFLGFRKNRTVTGSFQRQTKLLKQEFLKVLDEGDFSDSSYSKGQIAEFAKNSKLLRIHRTYFRAFQQRIGFAKSRSGFFIDKLTRSQRECESIIRQRFGMQT